MYKEVHSNVENEEIVKLDFLLIVTSMFTIFMYQNYVQYISVTLRNTSGQSTDRKILHPPLTFLLLRPATYTSPRQPGVSQLLVSLNSLIQL